MSQGYRIMADIKHIQAALATLGQGSYRLQKLPRQAVWLVHGRNSKTYRLTFQPAPINAWTLHPPDREASELLGKIEQALRSSAASAGESGQSYPMDSVSEQEIYRLESQQYSSSAAYEVEAPTAYNQLLRPWCVVQLLPHMQRRTVARFRRRNDADAHLKALRRLSPSAQYTVVFDPAPSILCITPKEQRTG
ncbi:MULTISPECIES: hypothetical protein [Cyanophyceae]|uniref:hypothetical protein n=1 Tax=Cyanophyceae TaxID=3028117 RepID=UPI001682D654|nr:MULTISPECIES: hypothetical protein [Cyanophyceae]MBD1916276.1 hypothetical protein [Phormidium sp. FACHB-77]MBD2028402.1 hypothetical protein [Phormidium sp. FACHB-322]MBD2051881.1 hypothetical protein [Leptolyngbya sp. FACHB-60]